MTIKPLSDYDKKAIGINRDEVVFRMFFISNYQALRVYAYSFLKDTHLAEDVASEIMWKMWHLGPDLVHISSVEHYMLRSVKNKCLNIGRVRSLAFSTQEELENQETRFDNSSPEHIFIQSESLSRIHQAIEQLPEKTKQAFQYVKEEKRSYKETAEKMDISVKTVDRHIQIAVKKLWDALKCKK